LCPKKTKKKKLSIESTKMEDIKPKPSDDIPDLVPITVESQGKDAIFCEKNEI